MPRKSDRISINNPEHDKRVKLTDEDRVNIRAEYEAGGTSQRKLAEKYKVSRRLIQFVLDPEGAERAKKQYAERRKDGRYYDKEKHRVAMMEHRKHKKKLYKEGLIEEEEWDR